MGLISVVCTADGNLLSENTNAIKENTRSLRN
jgi:hypothetical protein